MKGKTQGTWPRELKAVQLLDVGIIKKSARRNHLKRRRGVESIGGLQGRNGEKMRRLDGKRVYGEVLIDYGVVVVSRRGCGDCFWNLEAPTLCLFNFSSISIFGPGRPNLLFFLLQMTTLLKIFTSIILLPLAAAALLSPYLRPKTSCFKDRVVLITGPTSGIGRALAERIARTSPSKLILAGRNIQRLKSCFPNVATQLVECDFSDKASTDKAATTIASTNTHINTVINNAGISQRSTFASTDHDIFRSIFEVNFFSATSLLHRLHKNLHSASVASQHPSTVIWISSVQGSLALPSRSAYSASKFAVAGFCDSLRAEWSDWCNVVAVSPGYVNTNLSVNAATGVVGKTHGKVDDTTKNGIDPSNLADIVVERVERGDRRSELKINWDLKTRIAVFLKFASPTTLMKIMASRHRKNK